MSILEAGRSRYSGENCLKIQQCCLPRTAMCSI